MALHLLTESDVAELRRLRAKIDSIAGVGVTNAPDSVSIVPPPVVQTVVTDRPRGGGAAPDILMRVTADHDDWVEAVPVGVSGATPVAVAKPFELRVTPFDGQIDDNASYVYDGTGRRTATGINGGFEGLVEIHTIGAWVNRRIFVRASPTDVLDADGAPIAMIDVNQPAVRWRRSGV